jgi:hypothetical protein
MGMYDGLKTACEWVSVGMLGLMALLALFSIILSALSVPVAPSAWRVGLAGLLLLSTSAAAFLIYWFWWRGTSEQNGPILIALVLAAATPIKLVVNEWSVGSQQEE